MGNEYATKEELKEAKELIKTLYEVNGELLSVTKDVLRITKELIESENTLIQIMGIVVEGNSRRGFFGEEENKKLESLMKEHTEKMNAIKQRTKGA